MLERNSNCNCEVVTRTEGRETLSLSLSLRERSWKTFCTTLVLEETSEFSSERNAWQEVLGRGTGKRWLAFVLFRTHWLLWFTKWVGGRVSTEGESYIDIRSQQTRTLKRTPKSSCLFVGLKYGLKVSHWNQTWQTVVVCTVELARLYLISFSCLWQSNLLQYNTLGVSLLEDAFGGIERSSVAALIWST